MTWIFGSFLVTLCALASCHILISKQGSTIRALVYNRWVTGRRPCDENHAVIFGQCRESQSSVGHAADQRRLWRACKRVQGLAPPGSQKKIWEEEVLSPSICLCVPLSRIKWEMYFYKEVCFVRSLKFGNYVWLCFRLYNHYGYTTPSSWLIYQILQFTKLFLWNENILTGQHFNFLHSNSIILIRYYG